MPRPVAETRKKIMAVLGSLSGLNAFSARVLDFLQPLVALGTRLWLCDVFLRSAWQKLTTWDSTVSLFESEYRVPVLSPYVAAVLGTFGEIFFPLLLLLGLAGRVGAVGLFAVNAVALYSYRHVLLADGVCQAGAAQHWLWGFMLLMLAVYGPGRISLDHLLARRGRRHADPAASTASY
jgi:putative oxidoreductase